MAGLDSNVKLYCNFNSAIQDDYGGKALTGNGSASINLTTKKFGAGSLELTATTSDYVSITDHTDFDIGSGEFTFDFWVNFKTLPTSGNYMCLFSSRNASSDIAYAMLIHNNGGTYKLLWQYTTNGSTLVNTEKEINISTSTWYHVAVQRVSNKLWVFLDGKPVFWLNMTGITIHNSSADFRIGAVDSTPIYFLDAYIDEFRFSNGIDRYGDDTWSDGVHSSDANTHLLLHMDDDDYSQTFTDSGNTVHTVTAQGDTMQLSKTEDSPKFGTGRLQLDGAGDYLSIPDSSDWDFSTGNFTIEAFVRPTAFGTYDCIIAQKDNNSDYAFALYLKGTTQLRFNFWNDTSSVGVDHDFISPITMTTNKWYHVAVVRNSTDIDCYVNGVACSNTYNISTNSFKDASSELWIGRDTFNLYFNGYVDEVRISTIARYTSNFTPTTVAFTSDANTVLLVHMDGADTSTTFTDSSSSAHTITANGDAQVDTGGTAISPKYGAGHGYFDGNGDYLSIPDSSDWNFSNGSFCIEAWVNPKSLTDETIICQRDSASTQAWSLSIRNSTTIRFSYSTNGTTITNIDFTVPTIVTGSWQHVCVERANSTVFVKLDGVLSTTIYEIGNDSLADPISQVWVGNLYLNDYFYGYMDEVRVSDIIRYLPNFSTPSSEYSTDDSDAPVITALFPNDNAIGVSKTTDLVITFDETVVTASGYTVTLYNYADDSEVEAIATTDSKITISGQTVTIDINDLSQNTHYYTLIDNGAFEDNYSNAFAGITVSTDWDFTTIAVAPPTVYTTTPTILICDYVETVSAESGTVEGTIYASAHGYNVDDFIVNTTQNNASRRMLSTTTDTIVVTDISGQTQSDIVRLYKFTDHTDKLKQQSLNVNKKIEEDTEARFTLITDGTYVPRAGQYVKINTNSYHVFTGFIKKVKRRLPQNGVDTKIFFDVQCTTLNNITPRRTLAIAYDIDTTASVIVESMVNNFLISEGVASGTIEDGVVLDDDWIDDSLTIYEIIDSLAERSGFQWYIDKNFLLQFYQDVATVSAYSQSITDVGTPTFNDFRNVTIDETVENYNNKAFYIGNTDDYGNIIIVSQENTTSILEMQDYSAGSGVYGTVVRDTNMTNHNFYTATAGTTESTIVATNIGDEVDVGDLVFNATQYERRNVIASSGNTLTLQSAISGQTQSDVIVVYQQINDVIDNHLKRTDVIPRVLEFDSFTTDFEPQQSLQVRLAKLSVTTTETYIIESVNIQDRGAGYYVSHVVASKRNANDISTQRTPTYKDYFKEF